MTPAELEELRKFKEAESVHYARQLKWAAQETHAELAAVCLRKVD